MVNGEEKEREIPRFEAKFKSSRAMSEEQKESSEPIECEGEITRQINE
jgi:hypothetical protein